MPHKNSDSRALVVVAVAIVLAVAGCAKQETGQTTPNPTSPSIEGPPGGPVLPSLTRQDVERAIGIFEPYARQVLAETGIPGAAIAIVYKGEAVFMKGFGTREAGKQETVDPDTVFQLASLSKPLGSTVVAALAGEGIISWSDPITKYDSGFALSDPWVTDHVTFADLYSHRSGLPPHAGDILEDFGYSREEILRRLRLEPLKPFRITYQYTNFGLTQAGITAARAAGSSWEEMSAEKLYRPLGMTSTSSTFSDFEKRENRAVGHVREGGSWVPKFTRDPDAQSPAGGASSSVRDMSKWIELQLMGGYFDGKQIVDPKTLAQTHAPQIVSLPPSVPNAPAGFYGLGWNVRYDDRGRLELSHAGAFALGAATGVTLLPTEELGIVTLTNGEPIGVPDTLNASFVDLATKGQIQRDWKSLFSQLYASLSEPAVDMSKPPENPTPQLPSSAYTGTYENAYYGPMQVTGADSGLSITVGPKQLAFGLRHFDGNTFAFDTAGEMAAGVAGITFTIGPENRATSVVVDAWNANGLGTFTR